MQLTKELEKAGREALDEAISTIMCPDSLEFKDYVFYMHILSQCHIKFCTSIPAPAGVSFNNTKYSLTLNPTDGYFCKTMPLKHRIGIIKHEMLHIILNHFDRSKGYDPKLRNIAEDCALNQEIDRNHLPEGAIYPDNLFPDEEKTTLW